MKFFKVIAIILCIAVTSIIAALTSKYIRCPLNAVR